MFDSTNRRSNLDRLDKVMDHSTMIILAAAQIVCGTTAAIYIARTEDAKSASRLKRWTGIFIGFILGIPLWVLLGVILMIGIASVP